MRNDPVVYRLLDNVDMNLNGCWLWVGRRNKSGYGEMKVANRKEYTHRVAFEMFNGPIPDGKEIHHTCTRKGCLQPDHLVAVSHRENLLADDTVVGRNHRKTHCIRGHEFTPENTRVRPNGYGVSRRCIACTRKVAA
jgi:hypothetical protein